MAVVVRPCCCNEKETNKSQKTIFGLKQNLEVTNLRSNNLNNSATMAMAGKLHAVVLLAINYKSEIASYSRMSDCNNFEYFRWL